MSLDGGKTNRKYELVIWNDVGFETDSETCYVAAFFEKDEEGYDMRTVGDRFFNDEDCLLVAKHSLQFLRAVHQQEKDRADEHPLNQTKTYKAELAKLFRHI